MRNKLVSYLIAGLTINTLMFSGSAQAVSLGRFNIKLNDIGVGYGRDSDGNKNMYVSLPTGYAIKKAFDPIVKFENAGSYSIECGGVIVKSASVCHFKPTRYGDTSQVIRIFNGKTLSDTYNVVFTNLPVIQINITSPLSNVLNAPKIPGDMRVISGEFKQDTGALAMGIDIHGQTTRAFDKKSKGVKFKKDQALLDMSANDDWILDASYADTTFARNNMQMDIFNEIRPKDPKRPKGQHAIKGRLAEVIVNGSYDGVYILNQHVGPTILDLKTVSTTNVYKADYSQWKENLFFPYNKGQIEINFSVSYPNTKTPNYTPLKSLIDYVIKSDEFEFTDNIGKRIDLAGLADWYLLTKAFQDDDNTSKNFYLVQNQGGPFFIVPWDTGASFGLFWDGSKVAPSTFFATTDNNLINRLLLYPDTNFSTILKERWTLLKKTVFAKQNVLARFAKTSAQLSRGGALSRDLKKWKRPVTMKMPRIVNNKTVLVPVLIGAAETRSQKYLSDFLDTRLPAMDDYINNLQ